MSTLSRLPLYLNYEVLEKRNVFLTLPSHLVALCCQWNLIVVSICWLTSGKQQGVHGEHVPTTRKERLKGCRAVDIGRTRAINRGSSTPRSLLYDILNRLFISALRPLPT